MALNPPKTPDWVKEDPMYVRARSDGPEMQLFEAKDGTGYYIRLLRWDGKLIDFSWVSAIEEED